MTDQINTVNVYDQARKALAEIVAIEGVTEGPWTPFQAVAQTFNHEYGMSGRLIDYGSIPKIRTGSGYGLPRGAERSECDIQGYANVKHIAACDPATMQAIAALVSAQDARIDAQDAQIAALHYAALALLESDENTGGNAGQMFYDALDKAVIDTAATATAYEARIRADERERCAKVAGDWVHEKQSKDWPLTSHSWQKIQDAIRAMGGKADE